MEKLRHLTIMTAKGTHRQNTLAIDDVSHQVQRALADHYRMNGNKGAYLYNVVVTVENDDGEE